MGRYEQAGTAARKMVQMRQTVIYIFEASDGSHRYAFTLMPNGGNLPIFDSAKWELKSRVRLGDVIKGQWPVDRECLRRDLKANGFHICVLKATVIPLR